MVYEEKTLKICHKLTDIGEKHYREILESKADEILFNHQHPIKAILNKIKSIFKQ